MQHAKTKPVGVGVTKPWTCWLVSASGQLASFAITGSLVPSFEGSPDSDPGAETGF